MEHTLRTANPAATERQWAAAAHLAALILALMTSWLVGVAGVVGAGIVYLLKRDDSPFAADHAREAVNFNLSILIYAAAALAAGVGLVGVTVLTLGVGAILTLPAGIVLLLLVAAIALLWLVCSIVAAVKAWNGERYRYPLTIRVLT
ncbi:DUF4870 domain-containing protein [Luteimonas sp. RD2P54]|uniref:DUF4870 domain-containing protein n=1 Tax=Luteimonas endophytica TaxID=3042023 RepID=A0ABT6J992_9GAMM|nr:DUF4870 domain-containing protein [Luteimonas endophytica]MDH5823390.1 DUF4870 domain-containing protein [Luteimonas endophytica]